MPQLFTRLLLAALTLSSSCFAADLPSEALKILTAKYPNVELKRISDVSFGDLNNDGIKDICFILSELGENGSYERLVVLAGRADGTFALFSQSDTWAAHMRRLIYTSIEKGSIFLNDSSVGYTEFEGTRYQFKIIQGRLKLIGTVHTQGTIGSDDESKSSVNLVTNKIVNVTVEDKKRKESFSRMQGHYDIYLEDFSFATISGKLN
ncbi:hypothetical protein ACFQAT_04310 [Undibacterium arcticum]|uniref:Uncharacterized protein n=1 Tax=Undibacterium arcticum TaxID=1762892 RepID=A0ABV7EZR7_9BURK